jgi:hypothetical protein
MCIYTFIPLIKISTYSINSPLILLVYNVVKLKKLQSFLVVSHRGHQFCNSPGLIFCNRLQSAL